MADEKKTLSIRMRSSLAQEINTLANDQNRNFSNMIETLLLERLKGVNCTSLNK